MRSIVHATAAALAFLPACTSNDDAPAAPLVVWVFEERLTLDGEDLPLANVKVAFDPPGGAERVTRTTASDGKVTFEGFFTKGTASVTVQSDDHVFVTMLEASPETARPNAFARPAADLVIVPPRLDRRTQSFTTELRGTVTGKREPGDLVSLAASAVARLGSWRSLEPAYALRTLKARPSFLVGYETKPTFDEDGAIVSNELVRAFRIAVDASSADRLLDLDLSTAATLPTRPVRVRAELPDAVALGLGAGARASAAVRSADSGITLDVFAKSTADAAGRGTDIDLQLIETDIAPERVLSQVRISGERGAATERTDVGTFADGANWSDFRAPPTIPDPDASRGLRDPIPLDGFPAGADMQANLYVGGQLFWILLGPPGGPREKTFRIPYRDELPSADVQIVALSVSACFERVALAPRGEVCRFTSTSRDILLRKR